jgi:hypothetical protein
MLFDNSNWYNAYLATGIVSLLPNLFLYFIPVSVVNNESNSKNENIKENKGKRTKRINFQNILLCFAAAGIELNISLKSYKVYNIC